MKLILRLLLILILALLVSAAWLYRDQLLPLLGGKGEQGSAAPSREALVRARGKVDSLNAWRADSIVLTAAEMASVVQEGLPADFVRHVDSLTVRLEPGAIGIAGRLETALIPRDAMGPFAGVLDPWEPVSASGPVHVVRPGKAEWEIRELSVRGFPFPRAVIERVVSDGMHGRQSRVAFQLPAGVSSLRIRPEGVTLYRGEAR